MPALTPTNSLFEKTDILKFNEVYNSQNCKLMLNTLRRLEIDHICFTRVSIIHTHKKRHSKNNNFVAKDLEQSLDSFMYLGPKW